MTIGDNIKKYRKQNKLTQKALGELVSKSAITIRKYEANNITPSLKVLEDISNALSIEPRYLVDGDWEGLAKCYVNNMSNDDLITYKNTQDFKHELDNQIPLYDKLNPKELELLYLSKINNLKSIIDSKEFMINQLEEMNNLREKRIEELTDLNNKLFSLLGGVDNGK